MRRVIFQDEFYRPWVKLQEWTGMKKNILLWNPLSMSASNYLGFGEENLISMATKCVSILAASAINRLPT